MVRVGIPGGALTATQYLALDKLCDVVGNATLRITTRQGIQFHFVRKPDLPALIAALNDHMLTTLAACGDVARNTTCCPAPDHETQHLGLTGWAQHIAAHFRPKTRGYYEIWLDHEVAVSASSPADEEPFYGASYLPRKFKVGIAAPHENCVDVLTNDVGVVPVVEDGAIVGFTLLVGGGMGKSHTNPATFPRLAEPLTTIAPAELIDTIEAIAMVHRDHGDRTNREHARLKYVVDELGIDQIRVMVGENLARTLPDPVPVAFDRAEDHLGWHQQGDGRWFLGVKVDNGRVADTVAVRMRSGLRTIVERFEPGVRFTAREDVLLTDISSHDRSTVEAILRSHNVAPIEELPALVRNSFACPALPTCGLALAESERIMPAVLDELGAVLVQLGLGDLVLHVRMTGCPNGCARPYTAELGIVGRAKSRYDLHVGGGATGSRLGPLFCENVPTAELVTVVTPVLAHFAAVRRDDERFGDFCHRTGIETLRAQFGTDRWRRSRTTTAALPVSTP